MKRAIAESHRVFSVNGLFDLNNFTFSGYK